MRDGHTIAERQSWQVLAGAASEGLARGLLRRERSFAAVKHGRGFGREDNLGLVDLRAFEALQLADVLERQIGEEFQEAAHVGVLRVPPELPITVWAQQLLVEPHGPLRGLAHLRAV